MDVTSKVEERKIIAATLFNALVKTCNMTLSIAANQGLLSAHEALSTFRHHIVLGEFVDYHQWCLPPTIHAYLWETYAYW